MSSVTLVHPAKLVGRNEMPFGRDTSVIPSNIALDGGLGRGDFWREFPLHLYYYYYYYYYYYIFVVLLYEKQYKRYYGPGSRPLTYVLYYMPSVRPTCA